MPLENYDVVDVAVTSDKPGCDAILDFPLLDGEKKYTLELTEFTAPLVAEHPMQMTYSNTGESQSYELFEVRRRLVSNPAVGPLHDNCKFAALFANGTVLKTRAEEMDYFRVSQFRPVTCVNDLVHETNRYFRELRSLVAELADAGVVLGKTKAEWRADPFARLTLSQGGVVKLTLSAAFAKNFFVRFDPYGELVYGLGDYIAFGQVVGQNGVFYSGYSGLTFDQGNDILPTADVSAQQVRAKYPITRNFDLRQAIEVEAPGMRIPGQVKWTIKNNQSVKFSIASFPLKSQFTSVIALDADGGTQDKMEFHSTVFVGNHVFRRAEDKVKERYLITSSRWYQNVRLTVEIERRRVVVDRNTGQMVLDFVRTPITLPKDGYWSAKLRFRTLLK